MHVVPRFRLWLAPISLLALAYPAGTCGPFFPEAIFVSRSAPAFPYPKYVAGDLGVVQPSYPVRHLVIAYNILSGRPLSATEQAEAAKLQEIRLTHSYDEKPSASSGIAQWIALRQAISLPGSGIALAYPNSPNPPTIDTERPLPGEDYQSFTNCLDDAFRTAALTLEARQRDHGAASPEVMDWVRGQDDVFSNCAGPRRQLYGPPPPPVPAALAADRTPGEAAVSASSWLKQDRAYQIAAAHFYRTDYETAASEFRTISTDAGSPWQRPARYLVARAMIRRATVGQISDIPASADAKNPNGDYEAQQKREAALLAQAPARLKEAAAVLQRILRDPAMSGWHHAASDLLDLLDARLDPARQANVLAGRLTAAKPPASSTFSQNLIDLAYVLDKGSEKPSGSGGATAEAPKGASSDGLLGWIAVMQAAAPETDAPASRLQLSPASAAGEALAAWRRTHSAPWLVAALTLAQPNGPGVPELIEAAAKVATNSPAWLSVTYHRLRLTPPSETARREIAALLPTLERAATGPTDPSAINLFRQLQSATSPTLDAFLAQAARIPAAVVIDDGEEPLGTKPGDQPCGPQLAEDKTPLFNSDTAVLLNQRLPVRVLAEAALSSTLPPNLRFQVAQSAWTRAVLLDKPEIARSVAPVLINCRSAWKPVLDGYAAASTPETRHLAGLFAMMRFASTEPFVREGEQRPEGFATYSEYRDNWWCGNTSETGSDGKPVPLDDPHHRSQLFGRPVVTTAVVPDPPFVTAADRAEGSAEIAALQEIPGAPDYFAREALANFRAHPGDPENSELLGQAERVVRNGCRTDATKELNHQLFTAVQTNFPNSPWAKRYTTWE